MAKGEGSRLHRELIRWGGGTKAQSQARSLTVKLRVYTHDLHMPGSAALSLNISP